MDEHLAEPDGFEDRPRSIIPCFARIDGIQIQMVEGRVEVDGSSFDGKSLGEEDQEMIWRHRTGQDLETMRRLIWPADGNSDTAALRSMLDSAFSLADDVQSDDDGHLLTDSELRIHNRRPQLNQTAHSTSRLRLINSHDSTPAQQLNTPISQTTIESANSQPQPANDDPRAISNMVERAPT